MAAMEAIDVWEASLDACLPFFGGEKSMVALRRGGDKGDCRDDCEEENGMRMRMEMQLG